jgi:uncharacterized protein (UPF0332 family)
MNPRSFLDVADELATGTHEGHWRSAVSRAYYATFHRARLLFGQCGFAVPQSERAHAYFHMRLMNAAHPDIMQAGVWLEDLRRARNEADYAIDVAFDPSLAVSLVQRAEDLIRLLEEAAALPHVLAQITLAMRDYERDVLHDVTWRGP